MTSGEPPAATAPSGAAAWSDRSAPTHRPARHRHSAATSATAPPKKRIISTSRFLAELSPPPTRAMHVPPPDAPPQPAPTSPFSVSWPALVGIRGTHAEPAIGLGRRRARSPSPGRSARTAARCRCRRIGIGLAVTLVLAALFLKVPPITARLRLGQPRDRRHRRGEPRRHRRSCSAISAAAPLPFELKFPGNEFVLAFNALPIVLLMSVLTTLLFYWGILPPIMKGFAFALNRTMGVGGAVGLSTAANIFVGHVEAPLFIRPYLAQAFAQRIVRGDDRRHGRHRRHRAGALRAVPRATPFPTPPAISSSPRCWARRSR